MSIPSIEDYSLESLDFNIKNKVSWNFEPERAVILVHDMQKYFVSKLPLSLRISLVDNCKTLLSYGRQNRIPVVYTAQCGDMTDMQRGLLADFWGKGMEKRRDHVEIMDEIKPLADDFVLDKWRYSAFHGTPLDKIFAKAKRDQIIICGVFAHLGVLVSSIDAYSRDIKVFLIQDAIADFTKHNHLLALNYAAKSCAKVISLKEAIQ